MKSVFRIFYISAIVITGFSYSFGQNISDEARRHFDRGVAAVEIATSPADYELAIKEFEQAARLASDWPDVYFNLGMVQEKAGKYTDAMANLKQYLRLAPKSSDAETVRSLINKLEYKKDQEEGVKRVYGMMASGSHERKRVGDCKKKDDIWVSAEAFGSLSDFRMVSGEMQVKRQEGVLAEFREYHPELHPPTRKWNPVEINGRFYKYAHSSYVDVSTGHVVRIDSEVLGEIISIDPPQVKEIVKSSVTWGAIISELQNSTVRPWSSKLGATAECVYELVAQNARINSEHKDGPTPLDVTVITAGHTLHEAAFLGQKEMAELLIAKGVDINVRDKDGGTPLHAAILKKNELARLLIAKGADINARDKAGRTPLHLTCIFVGKREIAELLIAKGADINAKTIKGESPLQYAERNKVQEMVELLKKHGAS